MLKKKRKAGTFFLIVVLLLSLSGCLPKAEGESAITQKLPERQIETSEEALYYGYQSLSKEEQEVYRQIAAGLEQQKSEIKITALSEDRLITVFNMVMIDHPEYFWIEGEFQYTTVEDLKENTKAATQIMPIYTVEEEQTEELKQQIEMQAEEWIATIDASADTYEKIKSVYELLIREVEYDESSSYNQTIQSVFLEKKTVCMGYAKATQYLLNKMGIFCTLVTGNILDEANSSHAWNLVQIGENYYYVDTTWGSPGYNAKGDREDAISYSYLCCSDKTISATHKANEDILLPSCTDESYHYYRRKGCWYETYDKERICQVLKRDIEANSQKTELCFQEEEGYRQAVQDIVEGNLIQEVVQKTLVLSLGQQISWQISYGGKDNLLVILWN